MNAEFLKDYDIGEVVSCNPLGEGRINETFKVEATKGSFVLQKLGTMFDETLMEDQASILPFLKKNGIALPVAISTDQGKTHLVVGGEIWRLWRYISHERAAKSVESIESAAKMLARFHIAGRGLEYRPRFKIKDFHDTPKIIAKMKRVFEQNLPEAEAVRAQYEFILDNLPDNLLLPRPFTTLIHGDPKFDNFLFRGKEVVAIIDMDTMMWDTPLLDVGDALRSWCGYQSRFNRAFFDAACAAYSSELQIEEVWFADAMKLITLELAARFLIDYFEQSYFRWDDTKYRTPAENHLAVCDEMLEFYRNVQAELDSG